MTSKTPDTESITSAQARELLHVRKPIEVAWTSKDGTLRDDDGDAIDADQTVPWVYALGPFGSWPTTLANAEKDLAKNAEWFVGNSFRLGRVVVYKRGWGYQAIPDTTPL